MPMLMLMLPLHDLKRRSRSTKVLPASRKPSDQANQRNNADSRAGIVHIGLIDGAQRGEVEGDGGEEEEGQADDVAEEAHAGRKAVGAG